MTTTSRPARPSPIPSPRTERTPQHPRALSLGHERGTLVRRKKSGELGRPRVLELVQTYRHRSAGEIFASLLEEVARFREGPQLDDMTFIVVKTEKETRRVSAGPSDPSDHTSRASGASRPDPPAYSASGTRPT